MAIQTFKMLLRFMNQAYTRFMIDLMLLNT